MKLVKLAEIGLGIIGIFVLFC